MNKITPVSGTAPSAIDFTIARNKGCSPSAQRVGPEASPPPPGNPFQCTVYHRHIADIRLPDGWIRDHDDDRSFSCIWPLLGLSACIDSPNRTFPTRKSLFARFQLFTWTPEGGPRTALVKTEDYHQFLAAFAAAPKVNPLPLLEDE